MVSKYINKYINTIQILVWLHNPDLRYMIVRPQFEM